MSEERIAPGPLPLATEETYLRAIDERRSASTRAVLTFVVSGETYGIEIVHIREITKVRDITEVPRAPAFVLGVISVRGQVIPVLDLRLRLRLDATPPTRAARILVVARPRDHERYGLLVDSVAGVVRFPDAEIEAPPSTLAASEVGLIGGIARYRNASRRDRIVILLALDPALQVEIGRRREGKS